MSVASMRMPPSLRKPSMPARSVMTWKFTLRSPRAMAKRTILAISQPAMTTISASARRGRKSPTCARNARSGSSITSKRWSMSGSFEQGHQALDGDVHPVGAVGGFVAQLVEHLLPLGELQEAAHVLEGVVDTAALHRRRIGVDERLARRALPHLQRRAEALDARLGALAQLGRAARIAERAQHPRDVAQRRVLAPALGERPRRLALEVDDQEIIVGDEHLAEVVIAVVARLQRRALRRRAGVDECQYPGALGRDRLCLFALLDNAQSLVRLLAHARAPGLDVLRGEGLRRECRILTRCKGLMQLGRARGEGLDQREVGAVRLLRTQALHEALEIGKRVAPGVALVGDVSLQQRDARGFAAAGD